MKPTHNAFSQSSTAYSCSICNRRFISFGESTPAEVVCVCGTAAVPHALPRGIYELRSNEATGEQPTAPPSRLSKPDPVEIDMGYGAAHGYGPAHGGPTGPGDAPAPIEGSGACRPGHHRKGDEVP